MNKLKRIGALILALLLILMVFLTLYFAITGSPYFMASLVTLLVIPVLMYAYMLIYRMTRKDEDIDRKEREKQDKLDK